MKQVGTWSQVGQEEGQDHSGDEEDNPDESAKRPEGEEVVPDVVLSRDQHDSNR